MSGITKKKLSVVIADDNPDIITSLLSILIERNYDVDTVSDGYELLSYLENNKPDIIILDLMMPPKDGIEVLSTIKSKIPKAEVIIYTAFDRYQMSVYAREADSFFLKSEGPEKILNAIEELS